MNIVTSDALKPLFTADDLRKAHADAKRLGCNVTSVIEESYAIDPALATATIAQLFRYPMLDMAALNGYTPAFDILSFAEVSRRECMVLRDGAGKLAVAFCDPYNKDNQEWVEARTGGLAWHLVHPADFAAFLARYEAGMRAMDSIVTSGADQAGESGKSETLSLKGISEDTSPVVKLVHSTLYDALKGGASDIHVESSLSGLGIKYRIDGVLIAVSEVHGVETAEQVISRIKVMSELDIAERRVPQDGRFKIAFEGRPIDFRVSIIPSIFGEDAVLRVLDKKALTQMSGLRLDVLGFHNGIVSELRKLATLPYGMLLVTGPTGSGKTTTLYGAISETQTGRDKIVTIEDPVEYQLPGVLQIPVNEKKGLTFARGLRSILRHDPDKIMVGEIRDPETAQIAIQSALTGHLVFTTVHANNVFDVVSRFVHMGVDTYSFVSALSGVLAQRLVRVICPQCCVSFLPSIQHLEESGVSIASTNSYRFRKGQGCAHCRGTGYRGRKAVGELLVLNDEIREAIVNRAPVRQLKELAQQAGVRLLRASALDLVRCGQTTLEEVNRVTVMA